jgi:PhnB protein
MKFYAVAFGGTVTLRRFSDVEMEIEENWKGKILHGTLECEGISIMGSDNMPGQPNVGGNNIALNVELPDKSIQAATFQKLSEGGKVIMPLQNTEWGAHFGMVVDRFGICWMLNNLHTNR